MAILVVNSGSSTLKLSLFTEECVPIWTRQLQLSSQMKVQEALSSIFDKETFPPIIGIGHRFVHGGDRFIASTLLDEARIKELEALRDLAPLHNPACLAGIVGCREYFGERIPEVAVFDTAFHSTLPKEARLYAIPQKLGIRRFGFHGISHAFLWDSYSAHVAKRGTIITLHLGNGCSMTAIKDGRSIDTSMGFTPAEGLVMATRAGDIDAAVIPYLAEKEKKSAADILDLLNFHSGLLGLSETSSQMQLLLEKYESNEACTLAIDLFCYRAKKYLGAYLAVLEGADSFLFSGGIGENSPFIRKKIIEGMLWAGCTLDEQANNNAINLTSGQLRKISTPDSKISLYVIATDENHFIAKEVAKLIKN